MDPHEAEFGLSRFLNTSQRFSSVLKRIPSDFYVTETDRFGKPLSLGNILIPDRVLEESRAKSQAYSELRQSQASEALASAQHFSLELGSEGCSKLAAWLVDNLSDLSKAAPLVLPIDLDKPQRTLLHNKVTQHYGTYLTSSTLSEPDGSQKVKIEPIGSKTRGRFGSTKGDSEKYLHFTLYKENRDTQEVLAMLGRCLGINQKCFAVAGTKDRRAVTIQRVSAFRVTKEKLCSGLLSKYWDQAGNVRIADLEYSSEPIKLGQHAGNQFLVVLRDIVDSSDVVTASLNSLRDHGFLNYFGLQRFGLRAIPTYALAVRLLKKEYKELVGDIMSSAGHRHLPGSDDQCWFCHYTAGDVERALGSISPQLHVERTLLRAMVSAGSNGQESNFMSIVATGIATNMIRLYVHSLQSLIFNHAVSARLDKYGPQVVPGDLVMDRTTARAPKRGRRDAGTRFDSPNVHIVREGEQGRFDMSMVVMPLVGPNAIIPPNMMDWFGDYVSANLGFPSIDDLTQKMKSNGIVHIFGGYRHMVAKPRDLSFECRDCRMGCSECHTVHDKSATQLVPCTSQSSSRCLCVAVRCTLDPGVYLTMAMREATSFVEEHRPLENGNVVADTDDGESDDVSSAEES